jgi:hypothetical protein
VTLTERPSDRPSDGQLPAPLGAEMQAYRGELAILETRSQESFDKTLVTLAGGALGVSFAFVEKFLGAEPAKSLGYLKGAWGFWVCSLAAVLLSHYISTLALRRAIQQVDSGQIRGERVGGKFDLILVVLHPLAALSFLAGLGSIGVFIVRNL